jgi:ATP-dependent DNA ligase
MGRVAYIENGVCRLTSRKQNQFKSFGPLAAPMAKLRVKYAIIDGEGVCLDKDGKSVFLDFMRRRKADGFYIASIYCGSTTQTFGLSAKKGYGN